MTSFCSEDYIYQRIIFQFSQFGRLMFSTPLNIIQCISVCMKHDPLTAVNVDMILENSEMLSDYFKTEFEVKEGQPYLKSLPMIVHDYVPSFFMERLPDFVYDLSTQASMMSVIFHLLLYNYYLHDRKSIYLW